MTLIRLVQGASILAGITFAGIAFHGGSATAQTEKFCVVASNGKTACGKIQAIERACVTTDGNGVVCGKFKPIAAEQGQAVEQPNQPTSYRKESGGVTYLLRGCKMSERPRYGGSHVKCNLVLTVKRDNQVGYVYAGAGSSSITDSSGNTYPSEVLGYNGEYYGEYSVKMSAETDYVVDLYFPMQQQTTKLSLLNVITANRKVLQFRNIPVSN